MAKFLTVIRYLLIGITAVIMFTFAEPAAIIFAGLAVIYYKYVLMAAIIVLVVMYVLSRIQEVYLNKKKRIKTTKSDKLDTIKKNRNRQAGQNVTL